jgi:biopolymer transport protein ExbD
MKRVKRRTLNDVVELNITTFMNLMVILVPFLLITAVFSRMTVLEINLPALDAAEQSTLEKIDLQLELVVTHNKFIVRDKSIGVLSSIDRKEQDDWQPLINILLEIKSRYPEEQDLLLLFNQDTPYKTIIGLMDNVKSTPIIEMGQLVNIELFPNISIGDSDINENQEVGS